MREILIHDTRTSGLCRLEPREPGVVGIYACGPTVYDRIHVGNARPYVVFSLLKRFLVHEGHRVVLVINITDVNDKIYDAARRRQAPSADLAREMTAAYVADTDALGLGRPDHEPRATEAIGAIVSLIGDLIDAGHAYASGGDVYFSVRSYPPYGELSHRDVDDMDQGEGVEGAERKRDPLDFALWKAAKPGEDTRWEAPWGAGRPGWHIECSAMAEHALGPEIDIHGGGNDLIFPHHENEAAQTGAARGRPLARIWMHNGMIRMDRDKMAKSAGNIMSLHAALQAHGRHAVVLFLIGGHYRQPLDCSPDRLREEEARVARVREAARALGPGPSPADLRPLRDRFFAALADDFNTAAALGAMFEWIRGANRRPERVGRADLAEMLDVLGLGDLLGAQDERPDDAALDLLRRREDARRGRDWEHADRLRDRLLELGWQVRDGPRGPELVRRG